MQAQRVHTEGAEPLAMMRPPSVDPAPTFPIGLADKRQEYVHAMTLAYGAVGSSNAANWGLWNHTIGEVAGGLEDAYRAAGWTAPPATWDAFWARINVPLPLGGRDAVQHVRLVQALCTDYGPRLMEHVRYRLANDGNVHVSVSGPTGMGKSSSVVGFIDAIRPIERGQLRRHLCIDLGKLPSLLQGIGRGDFILVDEFLQLAGEGSRTIQMFWENLEDTLRASGKSLIVCSPETHDFRTMQLHLELVMWNPATKASLFVVWIRGESHGVVLLPWMADDLYREYRPWKDANVERSQAGQFREASQAARQCMMAFQNPRFLEYLLATNGRPKKIDFEDAIAYFIPGQMAAAEAKRLAGFMWKHASDWHKKKESFDRIFGVRPTDGFLAVAAKYEPQAKGLPAGSPSLALPAKAGKE